MFGQSKPVVFEPYASRRRRRVPRWLVLGLSAMAIGAGGVVFVQERYLPPRLSADATVRLRAAFEQADAERLRLKGELGQTSKRLEAALSEKDKLSAELSDSGAAIDRLHDDTAAMVGLMPPGPQGSSVAVRAGQFAAKDGTLNY